MTLSRQWIKKYRPKYYMILLTYWRRLGKNRSLIWKKISQCPFKYSINGFFFNIPNQKRAGNYYGLELLQYDYLLMIQGIKSKKKLVTFSRLLLSVTLLNILALYSCPITWAEDSFWSDKLAPYTRHFS